MKKKKLSIAPTFDRRRFDRTFIRQRDDFSCAAACCATVARLYGLNHKFDLPFFRKVLETSLDGVDAALIEKVSEEYLPTEKTGCNVYHKGIALGFIRHKPDGEDHVIVFLARQDKTVIYYDPYDHRIFSDHVANMRRASALDDPYRLWTANFPTIPGKDFKFWAKCAEENPYKLSKQDFWLREHGRKLRL